MRIHLTKMIGKIVYGGADLVTPSAWAVVRVECVVNNGRGR